MSPLALALGVCAGCGAAVWVRDLYTDAAPERPRALCAACKPAGDAYEPWRQKPSAADLAIELASRAAVAAMDRITAEALRGTWPPGPSRGR